MIMLRGAEHLIKRLSIAHAISIAGLFSALLVALSIALIPFRN